MLSFRATTVVPRMAAPLRVFLLLLLLKIVAVVTLAEEGIESGNKHQHVFTDSFPRNDEYDAMALEPNTPYGTPYGGFSRATASRLAALPLKLPSFTSSEDRIGTRDGAAGSDEDSSIDDLEPLYTMVRDNFGRQFACRSYHEDELEPDSLGDSMFDTPRLRKKNNSSGKNNNNDNEKSDIPSSSSSSSHEERMTNEGVPVDPSKDKSSAADAAASSSSTTRKLSEFGFDPIMLGHTIHQRLGKLTALCAQYHPSSWWSYEWCHQEAVKQFHVNVKKTKDGKIQNVELESITNLGRFSSRVIEVAKGGSDKDVFNRAGTEKDLAQGRKEIGRVVDTFIGGDSCPETGKPRVTEAIFLCCSKQITSKIKGGVLKDGNQVDTDIIGIYAATEDNNKVCHYNITLCTPVLCDDYDDGTGNTDYKLDPNSKPVTSWDEAKERAKTIANQNSPLNLNIDAETAESMSVVEILERTFGTTGNFCLRTQTGGWWAYEFCPGDYIRQYHEEEQSLLDATVGRFLENKKAESKVTEHILGRFVPEDHRGVTKENEWEHVVNATKTFSSSSSSGKSKSWSSSNNENIKGKKNRSPQSGSPSTTAGGNGAYYYQEYTKGDICDHEDVTDSAIKAGEFGEGGIERAVTVRYSCSSDLSISVKEDSTCHYIVDITVPTLCRHPLFRAPVSKMQVVKCLPVA